MKKMLIAVLLICTLTLPVMTAYAHTCHGPWLPTYDLSARQDRQDIARQAGSSVIGCTVEVRDNNGAALREQPTMNSEKLGGLSKGTCVTVQDVYFGSGTWYLVNYAGKTGWISAGMVDITYCPVCGLLV